MILLEQRGGGDNFNDEFFFAVEVGAISFFIFFFHYLYMSDVWVVYYKGTLSVELLLNENNKSIIIITITKRSFRQAVISLILCHLPVGRLRISQNLLKSN
jgi:predicted solute-binding protein